MSTKNTKLPKLTKTSHTKSLRVFRRFRDPRVSFVCFAVASRNRCRDSGRGRISSRVDAYFAKDGKPVTDLKQDEIEVLEDNRPQAIESFRIVERAGTRRTAIETGSGHRRGVTRRGHRSRVTDLRRLLRHLARQLRRIGEGGGPGLRAAQSHRRRERSGRCHDAGHSGARVVADTTHRGDRARCSRHDRLGASAIGSRIRASARSRPATRTTTRASRNTAASRRK